MITPDEARKLVHATLREAVERAIRNAAAGGETSTSLYAESLGHLGPMQEMARELRELGYSAYVQNMRLEIYWTVRT